MVTVNFFPLDIDYIDSPAGKTNIRIFGRTLDGKKVCAIDDSFEPYFWIVPTETQDIRKIINIIEPLKQRVSERLVYITKTEIASKKLLGKDVQAIKVKVNHPSGIQAICEQVKKLKEVKEIYETDIPFYKRYIIDKNISPIINCTVEGEEITENISADIILKINSITSTENILIKNPRILSFDIEVYNKKRNPDEEKDPIVIVSLYGNDNFTKTITWKEFSNPKKHVEFVKDEGELLLKFRDTIIEYKPDYLVGYYSDGFDLPYLRARADKYKIKLAMGLDKSNIRLTHRGYSKSARIKGIVHLDIFKFIKRIMGESLGIEDYDLNTVSKKILGEGKGDLDIAGLADAWDNDPEKLREFCDYNLHDTKLTFRLINVMLPNINEIIKMIKMPPYDVCRMTYGQLVENYLLTNIREFNELIPNRPHQDEINIRKKSSYEGGFVYEPEPGLYKDLVVFDFKGLHPSIITAHNICLSTLTESKENANKTPEIEVDGKEKQYYFDYKKDGFIPSLIKKIIERRNRIKEIIKEESPGPVLKARQHVLKILANSFYGYLAYSGARWYSLECAAAVSGYGRDYIKKVIKKTEEEKFKVVYSDTDSIFISLKKDKTEKDALKLLRDINHSLPSLMELEYEGFYKRGIFVMKKTDQKGAKKKYALIDKKDNILIAGFETVRGDWSLLAKEVQNKIIKTILKEGNKEEALNYVKDIIKDIKEKKIPIEKMIIKKQLKKEIKDYESKGPHITVAKKMLEKGEQVGPGSIISFVVSEGTGLINERAEIPDQCKSYGSEYYINNQIVPVVERIFEALGYPSKAVLDYKQSKVGDF